MDNEKYSFPLYLYFVYLSFVYLVFNNVSKIMAFSTLAKSMGVTHTAARWPAPTVTFTVYAQLCGPQAN